MATIQLYELLELIDSTNVEVNYIDDKGKSHCIMGLPYNEIKPLEDCSVQNISADGNGTIIITL